MGSCHSGKRQSLEPLSEADRLTRLAGDPTTMARNVGNREHLEEHAVICLSADGARD
jgi:hypothetical protein